jgi:hypothetical protein
MRSRSKYAIGVSILWAAACSGEPFTTDGAGGSGGAASAGRSGGSGGSGSKAGSAGKGGSASNAGNTAAGGALVSGGIGGLVGVSGSVSEAGAPTTVTTCMAPSDCAVSSRCVEATCQDGECGQKNLSDGPFKLQVPGDCKQARCESGREVVVVDSNDVDDNNECTKDACGANGTASHVPEVGASCSNGGLCSADGKCLTCDHNLCPVADACHVPVCSADGCKLAPKPVGTLCPGTPTDYGQCDEQGMCVDCTDNGGCDEASVCSNYKCIPA